MAVMGKFAGTAAAKGAESSIRNLRDILRQLGVGGTTLGGLAA